jgi:hypothetical protein
MQQLLFWPTLTILAGAAVTVPAIQNSTIRNVLYWGVGVLPDGDPVGQR